MFNKRVHLLVKRIFMQEVFNKLPCLYECFLGVLQLLNLSW